MSNRYCCSLIDHNNTYDLVIMTIQSTCMKLYVFLFLFVRLHLPLTRRLPVVSRFVQLPFAGQHRRHAQHIYNISKTILTTTHIKCIKMHITIYKIYILGFLITRNSVMSDLTSQSRWLRGVITFRCCISWHSDLFVNPLSGVGFYYLNECIICVWMLYLFFLLWVIDFEAGY